MKIVIKMLDWGVDSPLHSIDVLAVYEPKDGDFKPRTTYLLEQFPYITDDKLFSSAIDLACKLRSAGFDVELTREKMIIKENKSK